MQASGWAQPCHLLQSSIQVWGKGLGLAILMWHHWLCKARTPVWVRCWEAASCSTFGGVCTSGLSGGLGTRLRSPSLAHLGAKC